MALCGTSKALGQESNNVKLPKVAGRTNSGSPLSADVQAVENPCVRNAQILRQGRQHRVFECPLTQVCMTAVEQFE